MIEDLTMADFDAKLDAGMPHLIDFWADWCEPCHIMLPTIQALSEQYRDRVRVSRVDVHEHPELSGRFGIKSLPTVIVFEHGEIVRRFSGIRRAPQLSRELDELLR